MNYNTLISLEQHQQLLTTAQHLVAHQGVEQLAELLLVQAQQLSMADIAILYLCEGHEQHSLLKPALIRQPSYYDIQLEQLATVPLFEQEQPELVNVLSQSLHQQALDNCLSIQYQPQNFAHLAVLLEQSLDICAALTLPLHTAQGEWVGAIQLLNSSRNGMFQRILEPALLQLASLAGEAIFREQALTEQGELLITLASEPNTSGLLSRILTAAQELTHADGGTLYLFKDDNDTPRLQFSLMRNTTLNVALGEQGEPINLPDIQLYLPDGRENHHHIAAYVALTKQTINIEDAYDCENFDFTGTKAFDKNNGYRSASFLTLPLLNHSNELIGVLQLLNAQHPGTHKVIPFSKSIEPLVGALASYAAIALDNILLVEELKNLLDAFIKAIAAAIDAKSPHTSGHCQRVPLLMDLLAQAACDDTETFADFKFDDDNWYELKVASWLHDCGKLATPDSVLDKATKLHTLFDRIHAVEARFAARAQYLQTQHWQFLAENSQLNPAEREQREQELEQQLSQLNDDLDFLRTANKGGEFMADYKKERVQQVAQLQWPDATGQLQLMLSDDEVANLCIERGTLSAEERAIINDHMRVTIEMLESLPFPRKLRRVPEYAGGHHEKMDGSGFPKGLTREQMSIPARMMAIADIFEALTAKDRPYKPAMKISQALGIMQRMRDDQHIDPDIYQLFLQHRVWENYAQKVLAAEQLDVEDYAPYL